MGTNPGIGSLFHHPRWRGEAKPNESPFKRSNTFFNLPTATSCQFQISLAILLPDPLMTDATTDSHYCSNNNGSAAMSPSSNSSQRVVENQVSTNHSILGSGWFYSGYSGFHPNFKKIQKIRKERKRKRKETKEKKTKKKKKKKKKKKVLCVD